MSAFTNRWKQLPIAAAACVICGVLVAGAIYILNFRQRESYLTGRNFRLLAVLAQQAESAIDGYSHTRGAALGFSAPPTSRLLDLDGGPPRLTLVFGTGKKSRTESAPVDQILQAVFETKIGQDAFDTLALATPDGRLALAVGRREWEMSSMTLSALLATGDRVDEAPTSGSVTAGKEAATGKAPTSAATARAGAPSFERITVLDAVVAGVPYKMFVQPCCELLTQPSRPAGAVVVGLVAASTLRDEAMAVSPTLVVIAILLIVLAGLAWPFLNVALQGHRKRITRWDAFQLGFSGTVGLAIATVLAITALQCRRLEDELGQQLDGLAAEIDGRLSVEIDEGARALDALASWLASCPAGGPIGSVVEDECKRLAARSSDAASVATLGNYTFAALIDRQGQQQRKARPTTGKPPLVNVKDRHYFQKAIGYGRDLPAQSAGEAGDKTHYGPPWVLDSVVSYGNGKPSAVLARPTGHQSLPVASITLPMQSVIEPVLPPGFEFAVIDRSGHVVFHSDVQRNGFEDLFLETDRSRQLRALVASGVDGPVTTNYWGRPYIAHVRHAQAYGWSIVTLFNRRDLRGLMLEWTMVSIVLLTAYALLWGAALGLTVTSGAAWLWPDRFRRRRYALLGVFYLGLLTLFGWLSASPSIDRSVVAAAGFMLPAVACIAGVLLLRHQPAARVGTSRLEYRCGYCLPGALLLIIVGIVPGAAFVARSYDVHIEAYVKHRQLGIVEGILAPSPVHDDAEPLPDARAKARGTVAPSRLSYSNFLETSVCLDPGGREGLPPIVAAGASPAVASLATCPAAPSARTNHSTTRDHGQGGDPFGLLEAFLPFFSETSVAIRELVHAEADDGSWASARDQGRTLLQVPGRGATPRGAIKASSALPPLAVGEGADLLLVALTVLLVAMAYGTAYFIARFVFLGHVSAPFWALGRLAIPEGRSVILLCDPLAITPRIHGAAHLPLEPLVGTTDPQAALSEVMKRLDGDRHDRQPILVTDLDSRASGLEGVAVKATLLASLARDRRAVLALSSRALPELAEALEAAHPVSPAVESLVQASRDLEKAEAIELDWRPHPGAVAGPLVVTVDWGMRHWWRTLTAWVRRQPAVSTRVAPRPRYDGELVGERLVHSEERAHAGIHALCDNVRRLDAFRENRMSHAEILEEIQEGAEEVYAKLWRRCSDDEKLELRHIAQFGLASPGSGRAVRQLIARRLVSKDPNLRLMNHTFRRFVLSSLSPGHLPQRDVARIEGSLAPNGWDRYSTLFAFAVAGITAFLFVTQRDTYNATIGAVVALTTQLPNILKAISVLAQKDLIGPAGPRNA